MLGTRLGAGDEARQVGASAGDEARQSSHLKSFRR